MKPRQIRSSKQFIGILILVAGGVMCGYGEPRFPQLMDGYADIVERIAPSVVTIAVESQQPSVLNELHEKLLNDPLSGQPNQRPGRQAPQGKRQSEGSGIVVSPEGRIVTCNSVVEGAEKIEVILANGKDRYKAEVISRDPRSDLALVKIDAKNLVPAPLGDSSKLRVGDTVLAIGSPLGLGQVVTCGIVSGLKKNILSSMEAGEEGFILTDASLNPGSAGGPLIDNQGRVVGINAAILKDSGMGFAIPINFVAKILDRLQTKGEVERGYLGLALAEMTVELAKSFGVEPDGVLVSDVRRGGPAEKAGFQAGDIILTFQGEKVSGMAELRMKVANTQPGTVGKFTVLRNGKTQALSATIEKMP